MPTRMKKEKARALACAAIACALAIVLPSAAFADTLLGIRVYDGAQTPNAGDGATLLGIKVTGPTYTVAWDANGGSFLSGTPATTTVAWGTPTAAPATPARDGYAFGGWSPTKGGVAAQLPQQTTGAATWYAVWSPIEYGIAYELDGGSASNPATYTIETPSFALNNPVKEGWAFTGWSGTGLDGESNMSVAVLTGSKGDRSYAAHWRLNEYQVTFDANDGSGARSTQTFQHGVSQTLAPNGFARAGYEFLGWSDDKTATTAKYTDEASISVTASKTLYAVWKSLSYTVAFDGNGADGDGTMPSMDMVPGQAKPLSKNLFSRTGYTFSGWNTERDGSGDPYGDEASVDFGSAQPGSTVTLYAQWALQVVCEIPTAAAVTIDASGKATGEDQKFVSQSVEPLVISAVNSSKLPGADSAFADPATLSGVRVTLKPKDSAQEPVEVPLATGEGGEHAGFSIPTEGTLAVTFGLKLPDNAKLSYLADAAEVAQLSYVIGCA